MIKFRSWIRNIDLYVFLYGETRYHSSVLFRQKIMDTNSFIDKFFFYEGKKTDRT